MNTFVGHIIGGVVTFHWQWRTFFKVSSRWMGMAVTLHGFGRGTPLKIKNKLLIIVFNFGVLTVHCWPRMQYNEQDKHGKLN
jgi:hypothetical protein